MRLFYGVRAFVPGVVIVFAARRCGANGWIVPDPSGDGQDNGARRSGAMSRQAAHVIIQHFLAQIRILCY
jgi:hypothetical protein